MAEKPWVAFYWCGSCGGCEEAVVDLAEDVLKVVEAVNIGFWPVALDFKRKDVEEKPDGFFVAAFINGTIENTENVEMVELLRRKSKFVIAFGACSHLGGIPSLRNLYDHEEVIRYAYVESPSTENPEGVLPQPRWVDPEGRELTIPELLPTAKALDQVIDVDYYLPGCPPTPELIKQAVEALLSGNLPPKGSVLAPNKALCSDCPRKDTKPDQILLEELKRVHLTELDPELCFLAQGVFCAGPATRTGCGSLCINANMPCRGCFGPTDQVLDQGLSLLSAYASVLDIPPEEEEKLDELLKKFADPAGCFWRFSTAKSLAHANPKNLKKKEG